MPATKEAETVWASVSKDASPTNVAMHLSFVYHETHEVEAMRKKRKGEPLAQDVKLGHSPWARWKAPANKSCMAQ